MVFKKSYEKSGEEGGLPPRKMFKGDWKCADCGAEITELPFEPSPDRPIYCRECWQKRRAQRFGR